MARSPADVTWFKDGEHYLYRKTDPQSEKTEWIKVHAATGEAAPLFDAAKLEYPTRCTLNPNGTALLFAHKNDFSIAVSAAILSGSQAAPDSIIAEQFSPDGKMVSFVRDYDLWVVDIESRRERELTAGGGREAAERTSRLGLSGRNLRPGQLQGILVESGLGKHRLPLS